jgi:hypothetical protein
MAVVNYRVEDDTGGVEEDTGDVREVIQLLTSLERL